MINDEVSTEFYCFSCLGEVNLKDKRLGNSYLRKNVVSKLWSERKQVIPTSVVLFSLMYDSESVLLSNQRRIFNSCHGNFSLILKSASKNDLRILGASACESSFRNYQQLRKEICEVLFFIDSYFARLCEDITVPRFRQIVSSCELNLTSLWKYMKNALVNFNYPSNSISLKPGHPVFHLLHLQLDLQCYRLIILYQLEQLSSLCESQNVSVVSDGVKHYAVDLLSDLFLQALARFEKLSTQELNHKSPFLCTCVKELWLFLQIFMDKYHIKSQLCDFWVEFNNLCLKLPPFTNATQLKASDASWCSNTVLFALWMLNHVAQLYSYSDQGEYEGPACNRMVANYNLLDKIMKHLLSPHVTEAQLRICIPFIMHLVLSLWPPQRDPVCKLWEYFHNQLNSCFFLQGTSPNSIAVSCASGSEMLTQITQVLNPLKKKKLSFRPENSFHLFLQFLGKYLQNNPSQWSSIKGRIFSKFSPMKMRTLKEMGIYNFSFLFLCMALVGPTLEVGDKMQELFFCAFNSSLDVNRRQVVWKANLALLQILVEKDMDIASSSDTLMGDINSVINFKDRDSIVLFNVLAIGLKDIINCSKTLGLSEYTLLGSWICSYLRMNNEPSLLIDTLLEIMMKVLAISRSVGMIEYNASESHITKIYLALCKYLLPYIKEKFAIYDANCSHDKIADLAVNISLLALNRSNMGVAGTSVPHLFESFAVNANPLNAELSVRYVYVLLREEGILSELMDTRQNYHVLIIQSWLRCSVYLSQTESSDELHKLTQIVYKIPAFCAFCEEVSEEFDWFAKPVESFIIMSKELYQKRNSFEERCKFREECIQYLTPMVKSFERMLRCKDVSDKNLLRIYQVATLLIHHCGGIIYSKSQPQCIFNILLNSLLLPYYISKPGADIPPSILRAVQKTFPELIFGVIRLNCTTNNSLLPVVKNLVVKYFPRIVGKNQAFSPESSHSPSLPGHPLLLCFSEEKKEVHKVLMEIITQAFIKTGEPQCVNALMFLLEILQEKKFSEDMVCLIMDVSLNQILEVFIKSDASMIVAKKHALNLLREMLLNKINNCSNLSSQFWSVLLPLVQKNVVLHTVNVTSLLCKICEIAPGMMLNGLEEIKELMTSPSVFHRSNVAITFRTGVETMEKLLKLAG